MTSPETHGSFFGLSWQQPQAVISGQYSMAFWEENETYMCKTEHVIKVIKGLQTWIQKFVFTVPENAVFVQMNSNKKKHIVT